MHFEVHSTGFLISIILEISFDGITTWFYCPLMDLERTAERLEALGNATRLGIYRLLVRAGDDGLAVGAVQSLTGIPRSTLSHHLHRLTRVGLVSQERRATTLICRASYPVMNETLSFLVSECCADAQSGEDAA